MGWQRIRSRLGAALVAVGVAACAPVVSDLKASRNPHVEALHEQLSHSIRENGFSHGIRSVREDGRDIDTIFVAIPLDSLKRQHIALHHMLFNVARICARPEFANVAILIELSAAAEQDREYMRKIVEPIVADARNVRLSFPSGAASDLVVTMSNRAARAP